MDKPDTNALLTADHLESAEEAYLTALADGADLPEEPVGPVTLQQAVDSITRIRYHQEQHALEDSEADALMAPLLARIDQIKAWQQERAKKREASITFHESRLRSFYEANPPTSSKTLKLPGGEIAKRDQAPKWDYGDEKTVVASLEEHFPEFIRKKPELDKAALKAEATVMEDGTVMYAGVILEGIRVVTTPATFKVTVK